MYPRKNSGNRYEVAEGKPGFLVVTLSAYGIRANTIRTRSMEFEPNMTVASAGHTKGG